MVNKEMKFLDNGDIRYEIVDASARSNIQTINTVLDTKADTSDMSNYYTKSETYNKTEVDNLIESSGGGSGGGGGSGVDTNTTYSLSMANNVITLTGSDNTTSTVTLPIYNGEVTT